MSNQYEVTVHLSRDFRRTGLFMDGDGFESAAQEGCYDGAGFTLKVEAMSHTGAAEVVFGICNSYVDELHCAERFRPVVIEYRDQGNRSLSVGDLCIVRDLDGPNGNDGRYGCAGAGWVKV